MVKYALPIRKKTEEAREYSGGGESGHKSLFSFGLSWG